MENDGQGYEETQNDPLRALNDPFDKVFSAEMEEWVCRLPKYVNGAKAPVSPGHPDPRNNLVGLAMSGGGTRSATFSLGVTQALARYGLMKHVDYMSTVSGGGYLGTSFTSLCADRFTAGTSQEQVRLGMDPLTFPYADQNPYPEPSAEPANDGRPSPVVHGLETPATRHVRENSRLLLPGLGMFTREVWVTLSRYAASTVALWLVFLLPMVTAILLPLMLIPADVWDRSDPFTAGAGDWAYSLGNHPWLALAPLAMFALSSLMALLRLSSPLASNAAIGSIQTLSIVLMAVSMAALLLVFGVWGYSLLVATSFAGWELGAVGIGSAGTALASLRGLLNMSEGLRRRVLNLVFAVFGYFVLGFALLAWHHVLWTGWGLLHWKGFDSALGGPLSRSYDEFWIVLAAVSAVILLSWVRTDWLLNRFSMNSLYEERLQRTWVVSPKTSGSDLKVGWTGVRERPDLKVGRLVATDLPPVTPYPLVCTSLNLSGSTSPKLLNRRADSFVIGPVRTGSALTSWRPTSALASFKNMSLARAAAISAAALSPNMGRRTNTTLSIVTTLFNARLGWWTRNPNAKDWSHLWPPSFLLYWAEMFGMASHNHPYINLSDGGHFENMGIYELMRRRCKFIIAVDGTGEPAIGQPLAFAGLGLCMRRVRIDFGVLVDIDLSPVMRDPETGQVKSYFAVGRIRYPSRTGHGSGRPDDDDSGILVYIKGGIIERDSPPDLINYHRGMNPDFPHDPTADQQFDEPQFESYRELGFLAGRAVCVKTGPNDDAAERFMALDKYYQGIIDTEGGA